MVWAHSGERIAYGSTRRDGNDVDIWAMDPADPKSDHMLAKLEGGGWQPLDWSPDGRQLLVLNEVSSEESYLWLMDANSGEKTLLTAKGDVRVNYGGGQFSKGWQRDLDHDRQGFRVSSTDLCRLIAVQIRGLTAIRSGRCRGR